MGSELNIIFNILSIVVYRVYYNKLYFLASFEVVIKTFAYNKLFKR